MTVIVRRMGGLSANRMFWPKFSLGQVGRAGEVEVGNDAFLQLGRQPQALMSAAPGDASSLLFSMDPQGLCFNDPPKEILRLPSRVTHRLHLSVFAISLCLELTSVFS
jgi:hypothetical protein